jgi:hypothetical protein
VPRPGALSSHSRPPWASTMPRVMARPEPRAAAVAGAGLPEAVEHVRELRCIHARPAVDHADADALVARTVVTRTVPSPGVNFSALPIRLPSAWSRRPSSAGRVRSSGGGSTVQATPRVVGGGGVGFLEALEQVGERNGSGLDREATGLDARDVEQVADQAVHLVRGAADDAEHALRAVRQPPSLSSISAPRRTRLSGLRRSCETIRAPRRARRSPAPLCGRGARSPARARRCGPARRRATGRRGGRTDRFAWSRT